MSGLMLLANDLPSMLVPKANPRDNNSIFYYYFYSTNVINHLLMAHNSTRRSIIFRKL